MQCLKLNLKTIKKVTFEPFNTVSICAFVCSADVTHTYLQSFANDLYFFSFLLKPCCESNLACLWQNQQAPFSVVHFWSDYLDQRRMEQRTSSRLWCVFVSCCLKMPEPLCRQIQFFPLWSNPDTSVVRSVRRGLWVERGGVWGLLLCW